MLYALHFGWKQKPEERNERAFAVRVCYVSVFLSFLMTELVPPRSIILLIDTVYLWFFTCRNWDIDEVFPEGLSVVIAHFYSSFYRNNMFFNYLALLRMQIFRSTTAVQIIASQINQHLIDLMTNARVFTREKICQKQLKSPNKKPPVERACNCKSLPLHEIAASTQSSLVATV